MKYRIVNGNLQSHQTYSFSESYRAVYFDACDGDEVALKYFFNAPWNSTDNDLANENGWKYNQYSNRIITYPDFTPLHPEQIGNSLIAQKAIMLYTAKLLRSNK